MQKKLTKTPFNWLQAYWYHSMLAEGVFQENSLPEVPTKTELETKLLTALGCRPEANPEFVEWAANVRKCGLPDGPEIICHNMSVAAATRLQVAQILMERARELVRPTFVVRNPPESWVEMAAREKVGILPF